MSNDEFWSSVYSKADQTVRPGRLSALRVALLFGMAAVALALILPPIVETPSGEWHLLANDQGIDFTTTATVPRNRIYTIQRSVLQPSGDSVCIIDSRGRRSGDC